MNGDELDEALLDAWLALSTTVVNTRLVKELTYGESLVCNLLSRGPSTEGGPSVSKDCSGKGTLAADSADPIPARGVTATELCRKTGILKSQMNRILTSLERRGMVTRERAQNDRRCVIVTMSAEQASLYRAQHKQVIGIVHGIVDRLGPEQAAMATESLRALAAAAGQTLAAPVAPDAAPVATDAGSATADAGFLPSQQTASE